MIRITKQNYRDHFSIEDLQVIMESAYEATIDEKVEDYDKDKTCIKFLELELSDNSKIFAEVVTLLNEESSDLLTIVTNVYIPESPDDMDELLDDINSWKDITSEENE